MSFVLKPAIRQKINLLFAIAGASGSGKTYSALLLAQGIAGENGKIAVIDTEAGRSLQYAPQQGEVANIEKGTFNFLHIDFTPPFTSERYIEAIQTCEKAGASVIVIDSASHEWNGEGGISETAENNAIARATDSKGGIDYKRLDAVKLLSWAEPKKQHKRMMAKLTQVKSHIIFCLRAEDKVKMGYQNGKQTIIPIGFQPICEKSFMFEMTASMTMIPSSPGCPNYSLDNKLNNDMKSIFTNGTCVTVEHGQKLKLWAETGDINIPTIKLNNIGKSKLEIGYKRLSDALNQVNSLDGLQKITSHNSTKLLRAELAEKEPAWAGVIDDLVQQALHTFEKQEETGNVV